MSAMGAWNEEWQCTGQTLLALHNSTEAEHCLQVTLCISTCILQRVPSPVRIVGCVRFTYITSQYLRRSFKLSIGHVFLLFVCLFSLPFLKHNGHRQHWLFKRLIVSLEKVYMQAMTNKHSVIYCDRIVCWYSKDDKESKFLMAWSEEQTLIL